MTLTSSPSAARGELATDLVSSARAGDRQAMGVLYGQYRELVYRHAHRMLRCEAAARDVLQETFTRALGAIGRTREPLHFRAWIMRIATNLCLKQLAQRRRWVGESRRELPAPASADPERISRRQEAAAATQRALDRLPPQYRQLLLLRELEELSHDELARCLRSSKGRVKVTLHRARVRLGAEVLAEKLAQDREARSEASCQPLRQLLEGGAMHRKLVRHLESCASCKDDGRSKAILGLLPPVAAPSAWPELGSATGAAPPARGRLQQLAVALALLAGAAAVAVGVHLLRRSPDGPSVPRAGAFGVERPAANSPRGGQQGAKAFTGPHGQGQGDRPSASPGRRSTKGAARAHSLSSAPSSSRPSKAQRPASRPSTSPLQLKLQPDARRLWVRRDGARLSIRKPEELRAGDLLEPRKTRRVALRFPDHQWVAFDRRLRLVAGPTKRDETITPHVELLSGQLRARASRRGGGIEVRVGSVKARILAGLVRVRWVGRAIWIEAIEGRVSLSGRGGRRALAPGQGARFASGAWGASFQLLPAAARLRPVSARGVRPPALVWLPVVGAESYLLRLAGDTDFIALRKVIRLSEPAAQPAGLRPGAYFWQVIALRGGQQGMPSKIFRFEVTRR